MKVVIVLILILFITRAYSIEFEDAVFPEIATSGRALAMGNAFICKVDDSTAAFYNPAGLGTVRYKHLHLSNFHFETNKGWFDIGTTGSLIDASSNIAKVFTLDGSRELLLNNRGKISHSRFHLLPNFTSRYFTLGYLFSDRTRATIGEGAGDQFEYATRLDHGPYMGINVSLFGGIIKFGTTVIYLSRKEAIGTADPNTTINLSGSDFDKGTAFVFGGGMRVTLPYQLLPTVAMNVHNVADQNFSPSSGYGTPAKIRRAFDVGVSITPQIGRTTRLHLEINYKDALGAYSVALIRKILVGIEFDFSRKMFLRFGYGDGYGSVGIGIRSRKLEFDLTTYAVDTTSSSYRGKEDRRFALTLSSGI